MNNKGRRLCRSKEAIKWDTWKEARNQVIENGDERIWKPRTSGPATSSGDKRRYDERTKRRRSSSQSRAAVRSASKPAIMLKSNSTR